MKLLAALFGQISQLEEQATEVHADVTLAELEMSHGDLANLLRSALKVQHPGPDLYCWVRDVYDAEVIYELSNSADVSRLYKRSYSIDEAGAVTFGEPVAVVAVTNYVPVTEADASESADITGDLIPLTEKAIAKDGAIRIKVIQAGQGSSGYYPADVLKRDGPKVFTSGLHMHLDHPSVSEESDRPERSVQTLAGTLTSDAIWEDHGTAGPGLYANARVRSDLAPLIEELAPHIGVSIRAMGKAGTREIDGKKVRTIEAIDQAKSVDFVTLAGAGGKVLELFESARGRQSQQEPERTDDVKELEEAQGRITSLEESLKQTTTELARLREANIIRDAHAIVTEALAKETMPDVTRQRLSAQLAANPPIKDGALDREALATKVTEAVAAETKYLSEVTGGNPVRGMGGTPPADPTTPTLEESDKRIKAALASL